jgi:hypothetical protein
MPEQLPTNDALVNPEIQRIGGEPNVDRVLARILEKCLFVRASEVIARTVAATKDAESEIIWLTLEREFHHLLVTTVFAICKRNALLATNQEVKEALFDFLLGVVNGRPQSDAKKIEARSNRANRERKRLSRKRARAAKREREREEPKIDAAIRRSEATRTCEECSVRFTSRKRYSKHKCVPVPGKEEPQKSQTSEAKRARRVRARNAARLKKREAKATSEVGVVNTTPAPQVAEDKLTAVTPVTGTSERTDRPQCEDCTSRAVGRKHGLWPKCLIHFTCQHIL